MILSFHYLKHVNAWTWQKRNMLVEELLTAPNYKHECKKLQLFFNINHGGGPTRLIGGTYLHVARVRDKHCCNTMIIIPLLTDIYCTSHPCKPKGIRVNRLLLPVA